ncbi:MAG: response regulator [Synergistaceae bacterium]|jgi:signal transduction histidine kinase/CheY-like chemotaxis protein|nr:response regulator [Synergistaceae bacterium]
MGNSDEGAEGLKNEDLKDEGLKNEGLKNAGEAEGDLKSFYARLLLEACTDVILVLDGQMRVVLATDTLARQLGISDRGEMVDRPFQELFARKFPPAWTEKTLANARRVYATTQPARCNDTLSFSEDCVLKFQTTLSPALDKNGKCLGVVVAMHDVTELFAAVEQAEQAARVKGTFLAKMSHELRTPMNAIKGMSDLLLLMPLDEVQKGYVRNILGATDSLLNIVDDILDFSKISADKLEIVTAPYDAGSMISDVANMIHLKTTEKGLDFVADIDPSVPAMIMGDAVRVKQILLNLLDNAVKFTSEGCVSLVIEVRKREGRNFDLVCRVEDTGIGIREEDIPRLFEPFLKTEQQGTGSTGGSGLGLVICRRLLELMNGTISVSSVQEKGSVFAFEIPQQSVGSDVLALVEDPDKKRVLCLMDHPRYGEAFANMLRRLFVPFVMCENEAEFAKAMRSDFTHVLYRHADGALIMDRYAPWRFGARVIAIKNMKFAARQRTAPGAEVLFEPVLAFALARALNKTEVEVEASAGSSAEDSSENFRVKDANILIVDDNNVNLLVAQELLRYYGIDADVAESGAEALARLKEKPFDLVFMDHMMPEMDGIEATRIIKEEIGTEYAKNVPIIALTANALVGNDEMFKNKGFQDFLSKPIDIIKLDEVIDRWVRDRKLEKELAGRLVPPPQPPSPGRLDGAAIAGVDIAAGLAHFSGSEDIYLEILGSYAKNTPELAEKANRAAGVDIKEYGILTHGIKSSSRSIGALEVGDLAEKLEKAAKDGDDLYIANSHPEFMVKLHMLLDGLEEFLDGAGSGKEKLPSPDEETLAALWEAAREYDVDAADEAMGELEKFDYEEGGDLVAWLRGQVDTTSFEEIAERLGGLLEKSLAAQSA